jgi:glucose/arabinose dehydrogenase
MNQGDDLGAATPGDWMAFVSAGQDWKSPLCYGQGGTACTGVPKPAALDKHAAVSGVAVVTGQLGPSVDTAALVAEWSLGKIKQVTLKKTGSNYTATVSPMVTGLQHPVPVILSPAGSLMIGDWGSGAVYQLAAA